jgi:two-component system, chemotaxis family, chemotaxis protein CheY
MAFKTEARAPINPHVKILVVDDSKMMRALVKRTLAEAGFGGHEIAEAPDGAAALEQVASAGPDLVVSDWNMPNMTGIELLRNLRSGGHDVRFVFVTSEGTPEMRTAAQQAGALALIEKPFTAAAFKAALNGILA